MSDGKSLYKFKKTHILSTYLFTFGAGDIKGIHFKDSKVPVSLYCRNSLYLRLLYVAKEINSLIQHIIEFYEKMFIMKYPFSKCDIYFTPTHLYSAMEYPGLITIME